MSTGHPTLVVGTGLRGLWLSAGLKRLGHQVIWIQAQDKDESGREIPFLDDALPWQVGMPTRENALMLSLQAFLDEVIKPRSQKIAVQVLTGKGPLELSGPSLHASLQHHFPSSHLELRELLASLSQSHAEGGLSGKNTSAHVQRLIDRPRKDWWILDWLSSLRSPVEITTAEWILEREGLFANPARDLLFIDEPMSVVIERGLKWAENQGVRILRARDADIVDWGTEGRMATGIELGRQGKFLPSSNLVFAAPLFSLAKKYPVFFEKLGVKRRDVEPVGVWIKCGFELSRNARPEGMERSASIVADPYMPYSHSNLLLLKWNESPDAELLTVWCRVNYRECEHQSYLTELSEQVQRVLAKSLPGFKEGLKSFHPFHELEFPKHPLFDERPLIRRSAGLKGFRSKIGNVFFAAPEVDRGLELLSVFASEARVLGHFKELDDKKKKKESKRDRTIQSSRNGENMVATE